MNMPMGKGTYGSTVGRPKKRKKAMGGGKQQRMAYGHGGEAMKKAKPC
jgi:hypothetical protein